MQPEPLPLPPGITEDDLQEALKLYVGITREQLLKHVERTTRYEGSARATFPGPLRQAFASLAPCVQIGRSTYLLEPVTIAVLCVLEKIKSPFIEMVEIITANHGKTGDEISKLLDDQLHPTAEQLLATTYCFITPIDDLEVEIKKGIESFLDLAKRELGRKHHPVQLSKLTQAVMSHYVQSFCTVVDYEAKKAQGDASFPSAPAEPATASAGASTSAAH